MILSPWKKISKYPFIFANKFPFDFFGSLRENAIWIWILYPYRPSNLVSTNPYRDWTVIFHPFKRLKYYFSWRILNRENDISCFCLVPTPTPLWVFSLQNVNLKLFLNLRLLHHIFVPYLKFIECIVKIKYIFEYTLLNVNKMIL